MEKKALSIIDSFVTLEQKLLRIRLKTPTNIQQLVDQIIRSGYQATTDDLRMFAEKVKFFNQLKRKIREEIAAAKIISKIDKLVRDFELLIAAIKKRKKKGRGWG